MQKVAYNLGENAITIFADGQVHTVRKDNMNFMQVRQALLDGEYDKVIKLVDTKSAVEDYSYGNIFIKDGEVYYNHAQSEELQEKTAEKLHGVVVDKLLSLMREGIKDPTPFFNFIEKLLNNPSHHSVNQLYNFLNYKELPIDPDGYVIGYKGVRDDYKDRHSGKFDNSVGRVLEMKRRNVDDDPNVGCSYGFHVGSFDYADNWANHDGRLMVVRFNPHDAVSVPNDCEYQKLRVCKYEVIGEITDGRKEWKKPVYVDEDYDYDYDWNEEYDEEDDSEGWDEELSADALAIRNYIENRHAEGINPTVKQVQSRMKGVSLSSQDIIEIVEDLGFYVENIDGHKKTSRSEISLNF
tara:strand:- start:4908 stop:5966 length:1059 start_codon:yes stop_codon:yes gene_type:complete